MRACGEFVFKGLDNKAGGEFTNDKGVLVKYGESLVLKVDEVLDGNINERKMKIDPKNVALVDSLKKLKPYDKINLECDVVLYQNSSKVIPVAVSSGGNK